MITELLGIAAFVGLTGFLVRDTMKKTEEEQRRKSTPCDFSDGITEEQFSAFAMDARKHIRRLVSYSCEGSVVRGSVRTQSGLSEWKFEIDFNDYGHLTGKYWISSDNDDSDIPKHIAERIRKMIAETK